MPELVGDLRPFLVQILNPSGMPIGTGFLCHPDGFVLTCWHVMESWQKLNKTEGEVWFAGQTHTAQWFMERSDEAADLAILKLNIPEVRELPYFLDVYWRVQPTDPLVSFGYPEGQFESGIAIRAELQGLIPTRMKGWDADLYPLMGFNLHDINEGYSGAPVINTRTQKVIGLVNAKRHDTQAFMVPLDPLFAQWPELKEFHDIYRRIREQFATDAQKEFERQIKDTTFIPLGLEQGWLFKSPDPNRKIPDRDREIPDRDSEQERGELTHGRQWQALDIEQLLPPRDRQILVADVGAGKTTWLLWLADILFEKTRAIPLFLTCPKLEETQTYCWVDLRKKLISRYEAEFLDVDLGDFLTQAFQENRLVFLLDGLDQIKVPHYADLARTAFEIAGANAVLISARPSAVLALENDLNVIFLRLKSFSDDEERQYFGVDYKKARRLLVLAPELARVPMLAYMIRTLVEKERTEGVDITEGVETRTGIYQQFVRYILFNHVTNATISQEDWTLSCNLSKALSTLAYHALAETQIQRIEADLVYRVLGEMLRDSILQQRVSIEELSTFGLVNRVLERGENRLLFFTHQSFQEFLAAQYLAEDQHKDERNKVLAERWNPKWEQVIRFLAGLKGERILETLLETPDNIIHANLFLAASCIPELKAINSVAVECIEQGIVSLLKQVLFRKDALKAVSALGRVHASLDFDFLELLNSSARDWGQLLPDIITALKALAERLTSRQVDALAALLSNMYPNVREAAVKVLEGLGERLNSGQTSALVTRLSDESWSVQWAAAKALGSVGEWLNPAQVNVIFALLSNKDLDVCRAAVKALEGLKEWLDDKQIDAIAALLSKESWYVREAAVKVLGGLGERLNSGQTSALVARQSDENWYVREAAVKVLEGLKEWLDDKQIDAIAALLSNEYPDVREAAVEVLGSVGKRLNSAQVDAIIALLGDEDESRYVREAAVEVLGSLGERLNSAQVNAIIALLGDGDSDVRRVAVKALGSVGERLDDEQLNTIVAQLLDTHTERREEAYNLLKYLYHQGHPLL